MERTSGSAQRGSECGRRPHRRRFTDEEPLMTLEEYRAFLETLDPVEHPDDVREYLYWARRCRDLPRHVSAQTRDALGEEMISAGLLAIRSAWHAGAARVVSAAVRNATERVASAKRFGKTIAVDRMRAAGFEPDDYEINGDDIDAMVRAAVRRELGE